MTFIFSKFKTISLYLAIVVIPSIIISFFLYEQKTDSINKENFRETERILYIHRNQIDHLFRETIARLETMAIVLNDETNKTEVESILKKTYEIDPRFSVLFYVDKNGDIESSTKAINNDISIRNSSFYQTVMSTKKTVVSDAYFSNITNSQIVTICSPILDRNKEVSKLLVAAIEVDYLKNIMNVLSFDQKILVVNNKDDLVFETNHKKQTDMPPVNIHLNQINWVLKATPDKVDFNDMLFRVFLYFFISAAVLSIIFLLIQYTLLRRKASYERKQNEAQKLELVGTLAASSAHEIRNPLTGIKGFIQLLKEKYRDEEDQLYFSVINKEIDRINEIVSEFLVLGKPTAHHHVAHDIRSIVTELLPIIQSEANQNNVALELIREQDVPLTVVCTKNHIKQILLNLMKNSLESIENGGTLTITLKKQQSKVLIEVKDTGKGISKEELAKIFNPFFTSKDTGTGLGLVVCKQIVSMYKGDIKIDSTVNVGTTVTIIFPLAEN
ncbi:ATP-binding protein [Metabacillus fastidiosus]|uniref:ATP-binding protein n=1 Tax=Metabacillus fastidiosus TaxID=1458 RepID=UPI003D2D52DE